MMCHTGLGDNDAHIIGAGINGDRIEDDVSHRA